MSDPAAILHDDPAAVPLGIAILAKAPIPGYAKTRLAQSIGGARAAELQARLIARTLQTALKAQTGPVTLWAAPDVTHPAFQAIAERGDVAVMPQPHGDLGQRMLHAAQESIGATLIIGTDCPVLAPAHLQHAANALRANFNACLIPAEDGGYVLIGMRNPQPCLFTDMPWGTGDVLRLTRERMQANALSCAEQNALWDVDTFEDFKRLEASGLLTCEDSGCCLHRPDD